jgi:hypothetical protein
MEYGNPGKRGLKVSRRRFGRKAYGAKNRREDDRNAAARGSLLIP